MGKRMVSSHYILLPGGNIGRWPILECDENGVIINLIADSDSFKELPGLEFHSGMMLPGLIDVAPTDKCFNPEIKTINSHYANGTMVLGVSNPEKYTISSPPHLIKSLEKISFPIIGSERVEDKAITPLFLRVKNLSDSSISTLAHICEQAALELNQNNIGSLEMGKKPGVLLLKNFDKNNVALLPESRVKWLIKPEN